ncbi:MAG TPA: divalent-cation tolerance protein CutA [Longimicrobiaceae bacterium]|nr:divalent-cation tolerance protein CutA [Longimicrobiaceae bacterium]
MARSSQQDLSLVLATAPDAATAERIARTLVEERLVACVTIVPGATSVYRWQGEVRQEGELQMLMKTRSSLLSRLFRRVQELHPYDVPEVVSAPIEHGLLRYTRWVAEETRAADAERGNQGG